MIEDIHQDPAEDNAQETSTSESAPVSASEPSSEQKREIARWVADGMGLSDLQKKIDSEFGIVMTYMDVRFLVDDLDLTLVDQEEPESTKPDDGSADPASLALDEQGAPEGGVTVDVDSVVPPGAMASGSVTFSDGVSKTWTIDQFGRLGLSGGDEGYKPSDEDLMEFQRQLESNLRGKGM
ncbi:MAG: hypothetical protein VW643_01290 [Opitutales bacterium]|jgi:hypothetical protein